MERAELDLRAERDKWLSMFKDLYQLSKTGELAKMKATLEETLSNQATPVVSTPQSPIPDNDVVDLLAQPTQQVVDNSESF